jgi:hypothetical protein
MIDDVAIAEKELTETKKSRKVRLRGVTHELMCLRSEYANVSSEDMPDDVATLIAELKAEMFLLRSELDARR